MGLNWLFFHGFFGLPQDWEPIISGLRKHFPEDNFTATDLRTCPLKNQSFKDLDLNFLEFEKFDVMLGYSLGGRLLSDFFLRKNKLMDHHHLFLLASGCGWDPQLEVSPRIEWEDSVIDEINSKSVDSFYEYWNSYSVFEHSKKRNEIPDWTQAELLHFFDSFRLSQQVYSKQEIETHERVQILLGELDYKYQSIYAEAKNVNLVKAAGHRLHLDSPEEVVKILVKYRKEMMS